MKSQEDIVLSMLQAGALVTPLTIYQRTGSLAGHSRIAGLRKRGHVIICTLQAAGRTRWGVYTLIKEAA